MSYFRITVTLCFILYISSDNLVRAQGPRPADNYCDLSEDDRHRFWECAFTMYPPTIENIIYQCTPGLSQVERYEMMSHHRDVHCGFPVKEVETVEIHTCIESHMDIIKPIVERLGPSYVADYYDACYNHVTGAV